MPDLNLPQPGMEALLVFIAAVLVSIALSFSRPFYPFERLFTSVHELGHAFATVLTGGQAEGFWVYWRPKKVGKDKWELGKTKYRGGNLALMAPAGHLGQTLFGAVLILLSGWPYIARYTLAILGIFLIWAIFFFGRGFFTLALGLLWGLLFIGVAWTADLIWVVFLLYLVAIMAVFDTFTALKGLADTVKYEPGGDDASVMAALTGCSGMFWVTAWTIFSILILAAVFWFVWLRPLDWQPLTLK